MARVPFLDAEDLPDHAELVERIRGQRRGNLINVYRTLLHSPPLAESWFEHINRVRWGIEISGRLREIVIIRLGHLVKSAYVLRQHVPKLAEAEGMTREECDALADWRNSALFDASEKAVLGYVDAMARDIVVPDAVFAPLKEHFSDRQVVEITLMVGAYISHSRVLQALEVDLEPDETAGV
jgi:alkylhydroperoxidase family enzyme